jgi:hypothetical protein
MVADQEASRTYRQVVQAVDNEAHLQTLADRVRVDLNPAVAARKREIKKRFEWCKVMQPRESVAAFFILS